MAFSTAVVGRINDWEQERREAEVARATAADKSMYDRFERTAAELAGPDETLRRVLTARLVDAYRSGRDQERSDDHYHRFGWLETKKGSRVGFPGRIAAGCTP